MKTITASVLKKRIKGKKILIDTNIIIYLTDRVQPFEPLSKLLFEMFDKHT
jgi:rRNA-processing protein FCF1